MRVAHSRPPRTVTVMYDVADRRKVREEVRPQFAFIVCDAGHWSRPGTSPCEACEDVIAAGYEAWYEEVAR